MPMLELIHEAQPPNRYQILRSFLSGFTKGTQIHLLRREPGSGINKQSHLCIANFLKTNGCPEGSKTSIPMTSTDAVSTPPSLCTIS